MLVKKCSVQNENFHRSTDNIYTSFFFTNIVPKSMTKPTNTFIVYRNQNILEPIKNA